MKKSIFLFFAAILCAIGMNAATPEKLYLTPNSNWNESNARFAAYFFGNGEKWVSMTKVTGETNLYEVTTPAGYPNVIFCRMNPNASANNWNNKWNQTGDLTIPTNGNNHFTVPNGSWDGATTTWSIWPIPAEKTYKDITFTITASSAPQIHYWDGGDKMVGSAWENLPTMSETAAGSGVYTYTVKDVDEFTGVKYLFKIGNLQTADQTTSVDVTANLKDFFPKVAVMGVNNWDGTDVMTVADDYLSASITLPLTAKKYDLKLTVDGEWKGHKDQNHITRDNNSSVFKDNDGNGSITADYAGDYVFTYTYANQTLTVTYPELPAVKTYKDIVITVVANVTPKIHYWDGGDKVVATDWENKPDMVATGAANTYSYTIKDVDEALGVKYIIVAGTAQTEDLHTTVDVTANFKDLLPAVEVMGIKGWNAGEGIPMTIAEDYSASATINFTEAKTQEFKLTVGGAWKGHSENNKITRANNSSAFTEDNGNASVKVDVAGDYVFTYTYSDKKLTVTYPASDEPIVPHYYIAGTENLTGFNWQVDGLEIAKDGDVYKHTFSELPAGEYEFKITDGTWDNQWNYNNLAANYVGIEQGKDGEGNPNGNIKIITEEAKNITVIFDPANNEITLENWAEAAPATVTYVLMGVNGDWTTGIEMDVNPDNDKEYMLTCQAISATDAVKVVKLEDGEQVAWYGSVKDGIEVTVTYDGMGNIQLSEGYYNFYFDSSLEDKQLWIAAATDCVTEPTEKTIVEENAVCTIGRDGSLTMEGQELYVEIGEFDAENVLPEYIAVCTLLSTWDAGTCEAATATLNDNVLTLTGTFVTEESGETYKFTISGELPSGEVESQEVNVVVANLVVEYNSDSEVWVLFGTDGEYTFTLALNEEPVAEKEYTLNEDNSQVRYSRYRSFVTGSLTKQYDDTYGDMYVGQLSATFDDVPYTISLTMYNYTVVDAEPIDLFAEATYTIEDDMLTVVADWEGTPVQGILVGFENVSGQEFDEVWLSVGEGEDEFYISGSAVVTIEDGLIGIEGLFTFADEEYYNVYIWGDIPATEPTPDYTHTPTNKYGTICLQYAAATTTGAYFYEVAGKEEGKVYLASVDALEAGVPYIFEATASTITVTYTGEAVVAPVNTNANGLIGTFVEIEVPNGDYILYGDKFCTNNDSSKPNNKIGANRAYLDMDAVTGGAPVQMPGRRYIGMSVQGENEATGFENITAPADKAVKAIVNGQLIIIRNGEKFNAQGQKL